LPARPAPNFKSKTSFHLWNLGSGVFRIPVPGESGICVAKERPMLNPAIIDSLKPADRAVNFWIHILKNEELQNSGDLEKLLVGCEIIAALDAVDLLAA